MVLCSVVDVHTTCFGLHGHLQVCKIFSFLVLKESAYFILFNNLVLPLTRRQNDNFAPTLGKVAYAWLRQSDHRWLRSCQPYTPAALCSPETLFFSSGIHFCYRLIKPQRPSAAGRIR
jgi:hypothetical protein